MIPADTQLPEKPEDLKDWDELAEPERRLAGVRVKARTNGPSRRRQYTAMALKQVSEGREVDVTGLPSDARIGDARWSPDGRHAAFTLTVLDGIELWVMERTMGPRRPPTSSCR